MLTFRNFTIRFFVILLFFNAINFFICPGTNMLIIFFCANVHLFYYSLIIVYIIIPVVFSFFPCLEFHHKPVICKGDVNEKEVVLTFDDGPDPENTRIIMDILDKVQVKATFFIIGKKIKGNEELIRQIIRRGHKIGNHSYEHSKLWDLHLSGNLRNDIQKTKDLIFEVTGVNTNYFRPPYGVINPMVHGALKGLDYKVIAWSKRSFDTILKSEKIILRRMTGNLKPGDILLFHDTSKLTIVILEQIIIAIQKENYRIVSLDKFINTDQHG